MGGIVEFFTLSGCNYFAIYTKFTEFFIINSMEYIEQKEEENLLLKNILLAIGYFVLAQIGLSLAFEHGQVSPIWPPAGMAVAAVFICRYKYVFGLFTGAFITNFVIIFSSPHGWEFAILPSFFIAIGNLLEAIIGVYIFKKITKEEFIFSSTKSVLLFPFLCGVGCLVAALIGVSTLTFFEIASKELFFKLFITWSIGDLGGVLIVAPIFIFLKRYGLQAFKKDRLYEFSIYLVSSAILSYFVFVSAYSDERYKLKPPSRKERDTN